MGIVVGSLSPFAMQEIMRPLPIDKIKHQFTQTIANSHLVVEAETGSGKSTRLPMWATSQGRVLVIEPRRIACTSLAEFLAEEDGSTLGCRIGYAIKLKSLMDEKTQVVFVTPGVALKWFSENKLSDFDLVLVDEFHERRWDIDLLVALLLEIKQHRLVITSATIEGDKIANYIGAKRLVAEGRQYQVKIAYQSLDPHHLPDRKNSVRDVVDAVKANYQKTEGDILVFMPGRKEITQCVQLLKDLADVDVVMLYASVTDSERNRALKRLSTKKIVISTNVAETSLTIPNITLVIDSGLERRTLQRNGRTVLSLKTISRASAKQRSGRAGRVVDGECIRLYGNHAALEAVTPPELLREELTEPMLAAACCGFSITHLSFLDVLPNKSLDIAQATLHKMGALSDVGVITQHGKTLYPLPIDVLYADLITRMPTKACKEVMIDLAAVLSVPGMIYKLPNDEDLLEKLARWEPNSCDGEIAIKLIRGEQLDGLEVDVDALNEAKGLARQMRTAFELPDVDVASRYCRNEFLSAIARSHSELVFVRRQKRRQALGNGIVELVPAKNSRFNDKAEAAIILDQHSLPGRGSKQTINLATVMLPIPLSMLVELGIGEWIQGETVLEKDKLFSQFSLVYAGRTILIRRVEPEGDLRFKPLLDAVVSNKILPGFAKKRTQEIRHWCLYNELNSRTKHGGIDHCTSIRGLSDILTFEQWFINQLRDLGVSQIDELTLFSEDDLTFEGIPYWEYDEFACAYPFSLQLADLNLQVEYLVSKKLIVVVYDSGSRKGEPKRWELPHWKGWKIQYKKASRIVDVR